MSGRHGKKKSHNPAKARPPIPSVNAQLSEKQADTEPDHTCEQGAKDTRDSMNWKQVTKPDPFDVAVYGLVGAFIVALNSNLSQ